MRVDAHFFNNAPHNATSISHNHSSTKSLLKRQTRDRWANTFFAAEDGALVAIAGEGRGLPILGDGGGKLMLFGFCGVAGKESIAVTRDETLTKLRFGTVSG